MAGAAFFDLDRTLLTVNSGALWVKHERRRGRLTRSQYMQAIGYLVAYRLNVIDMVGATRKALQTIKGETEQTVRDWTHAWYYDEVAGRVAPGARRALAAHRAAGHLLVLLSTTSPYEAEIAAEHLSLDAHISSTYEVRAGRFTGEPVLPLCYGQGKVELAERFASDSGIDLSASYFYSDSGSDLPMLSRVGFPRVVNPDFWLRRQARMRGWPVLDWRRPDADPPLSV